MPTMLQLSADTIREVHSMVRDAGQALGHEAGPNMSAYRKHLSEIEGSCLEFLLQLERNGDAS